MSRAQLALNVANLDQAVAFYTKLFGASRPSSAPDMPISPSPTRPSSSCSSRTTTLAQGRSTTWGWSSPPQRK